MPSSYFSDLEKQELSHVTPWCEPNIVIFQPLESQPTFANFIFQG